MFEKLKADYTKAIAEVKKDFNYIRRGLTLVEIESYVEHLEEKLGIRKATSSEAPTEQAPAPYSDNAAQPSTTTV